MSNLKQLEQAALNLTVQERERLVLSMWDSLEGVAGIDPEGIAVARERDAQLGSGAVVAIDHAEFRRYTSAPERGWHTIQRPFPSSTTPSAITRPNGRG